LRESLNAALKKAWQEWEIPREADAKWPAEFRVFFAHSNLLVADDVRIRFYCAFENTEIRTAILRGSLSYDTSNAVVRQEFFFIGSIHSD
jgi:hypothetical protein